MEVRQVKCPPQPKKSNVTTLRKKWIPALSKYALLYPSTAVGDVGIGINELMETSIPCSSQSSNECIGKNVHRYIRNIPTTHTICHDDIRDAPRKVKRIAGRGLVGGVIQDIGDINVGELFDAFLNPVSRPIQCELVPVAHGAYVGSVKKYTQSKDDVEQGKGWTVTPTCIESGPRLKFMKPTPHEMPIPVCESFQCSRVPLTKQQRLMLVILFVCCCLLIYLLL